MTKVTSEIRIDAPRDKVWDVVADLGTVSVWNPVLADSHYTSEAKEGVGASRHCDFPDGGYVKERATEWKPGKVLRWTSTKALCPSPLPTEPSHSWTTGMELSRP